MGAFDFAIGLSILYSVRSAGKSIDGHIIGALFCIPVGCLELVLCGLTIFSRDPRITTLSDGPQDIAIIALSATGFIVMGGSLLRDYLRGRVPTKEC